MDLFYDEETSSGKPKIGRDPHQRESGGYAPLLRAAVAVTCLNWTPNLSGLSYHCARCTGGSREVTVNWPSLNASWKGWFDEGIFDSKEKSKQLTATGTLTLAAGTITGEFRHRLGNGVIKGSAGPGSVRYLVPLSGKHIWPDGVEYVGTFDVVSWSRTMLSCHGSID